MMVPGTIRSELMRFQMEDLRRAAEEHHRMKRRSTSPRRPSAGHDHVER